MMKLVLCVLAGCFLVAVSLCWTHVSAQEADDREWAAFEVSDLLSQRADSQRAYLPFLRTSTLHTGIYVLPKEGQDGQQPHREDEVYYVLSGRGQIRVGSGDRAADQAVKKGSVIFVKAGVEHRFHSIEEQLELLVFFSSAKSP